MQSTQAYRPMRRRMQVTPIVTTRSHSRPPCARSRRRGDRRRSAPGRSTCSSRRRDRAPRRRARAGGARARRGRRATCPRAAARKDAAAAASPSTKRVAHVVADLECVAARSPGRATRRCRRPRVAIAATVFSSTPAARPRQPACAMPTTRALALGEQHRQAIGREHREHDVASARDGARRRPAALRAATTCRRCRFARSSVPCT